MIETPPSEPRRRKPKTQNVRGPSLRTEAVALATLSTGSNAARELNLPVSTVNYWVSQSDPGELAALLAAKRQEIAERVARKLGDAYEVVLDAILEQKGKEMNGTQVQALATAAGIMGTKLQELTGSSGMGGRFAADGANADAVADRILERTKVQPKGSEPQA